MREERLGQITVFYLEYKEFEDAGLKNRCLIQTQTPYIAYVLSSQIKDSILYDVIDKVNETLCSGETDESLYAFTLNDMNFDVLDYIGVFETISVPIGAVLFPKTLIKRAGAFNQKIVYYNNFEFICRLVRETDYCKIIACGSNVNVTETEICNDPSYNEGAANTYAYMIRQHMSRLHTLGMMEQVFTSFCTYTNKVGIYQLFQQKVNFFLSNEKEYEKIACHTAPFIILQGDDTCWGVLSEFANDLYNELADKGQAVIMMDDNFEQHDQIQNIVCKGIVGFQNKGLEIDFFRKIHGPKFQFWFDNPLHFETVLRNLPEDYFILCQDAYYASYIREYYNTRNAIQFPPGGKVLPDNGEPVRPYDIVFVGSFFEDVPDMLEGQEREFYEYMIHHPCETFEQGVRKMSCGNDGNTGNDETKDDNWNKEELARRNLLLKKACRMVIGHFRNVVISTILNAGFTVHVYGESWRLYSGSGKENLVIHPPVTVDESLIEMRKSKIGLNIMSWHKAGMTERVANIMLSGAVCLTESTEYIREHMREGEEIVSFGLDRLDKLPILIKDLLDDEEKRKQIADNALRKALKEYTWEKRAEELIALSESAGENALTIFVATHVKFEPPSDPIYVPLHVGKYGKRDLGYIGDDTGENISDLNFLYGELTGLFWIWNNINDLDYVGLCHYRRYFINDLQRELSKGEYIELLEQYDAIVPMHAECEGDYYTHFGRAHNSRDLDAVGRALKRLYPSYGDAYDRAMESSVYYGGNLMVTKLPIMKAYAEWLFNIFVEASEEIDVSGYDDYHRRVYGFLAEQMFYVFAMTNGLNCCEVMVGISEEKAETRALIDNLKRLLAENKLNEARQVFDSEMSVRPDLLLPGSDINGELKVIYQRLITPNA